MAAQIFLLNFWGEESEEERVGKFALQRCRASLATRLKYS